MPRRFIAGAVCPECSEQDTIAVEMVDGVPQTRECVRCGFTDVPPEATPSLPRGRLEKPRAPREEAASPVRLVQFDKDV